MSSYVASYLKLQRLDRAQAVLKLRIAQAERRREAEALPLCPDCGKRHAAHPLAALFASVRTGDEREDAPTFIHTATPTKGH